MLRGNLHGDPTLAIERARKRDVYRTTFSNDQVRAIVASQDELRDRVAVRLLLNYGLRKGALKAIQFKHFDHYRKRLTVFTKGEKVRELPIPHPEFWFDLERLILEFEAQPTHYLMQQQQTRVPATSTARRSSTEPAASPTSRWATTASTTGGTRCLERAGIVAAGTTSGERMHKARHTAGQRVLDATGNLKATQKLLGHESIQTTGDVYADWDIDQLADTMRAVLEGENESFPPSYTKPLQNGDYGGGGNRTRVRSRTGQSFYRLSSPLISPGRPVCERPTAGPAILLSHPSGDWLSFGASPF